MRSSNRSHQAPTLPPSVEVLCRELRESFCVLDLLPSTPRCSRQSSTLSAALSHLQHQSTNVRIHLQPAGGWLQMHLTASCGVKAVKRLKPGAAGDAMWGLLDFACQMREVTERPASCCACRALAAQGDPATPPETKKTVAAVQKEWKEVCVFLDS